MYTNNPYNKMGLKSHVLLLFICITFACLHFKYEEKCNIILTSLNCNAYNIYRSDVSCAQKSNIIFKNGIAPSKGAF